MPLKLYHQVGHNAKWNVDSFVSAECGDGLILSPLHQNMDAVAKLDQKTRSRSLFDPQFYLPSSQKPKLLQYPFFPSNVDGGFATTSFKASAKAVAEQCIDYQVMQGFEQVVIPTRFIDQLYSNYVDRHKQFTVEAFVESAEDRKLCLSLAVTSAMIEDAEFRSKILNWISSYPTVDHVYLMYQHERDTKQIQSSEFLIAAFQFFKEILDTGLRLTVGYLNGEALLYSLLGDVSLTVGAFENTRIFSIDKFVMSDEERRGPKARIYLPGLMNWVQFDDAKSIRVNAPEVWKSVYRPTDYSEQALALKVDPTFNQPPLYKHYFLCMQQDFEQLDAADSKTKRDLLKDRLASAHGHYKTLSSKGVQIERHGRGGHVAPWLDFLKSTAADSWSEPA